MKKVRKLKIHSKSKARTNGYIHIPEIRLEGKWLKELGFNEGQEVRIQQGKKRLIITLNEENQPSVNTFS
jgi:toxic protein SymE